MMVPTGIGCLALDFDCRHKGKPTAGGMRHQEEQGMRLDVSEQMLELLLLKSDIVALSGEGDTSRLHWRAPGLAPGMRFPMRSSPDSPWITKRTNQTIDTPIFSGIFSCFHSLVGGLTLLDFVLVPEFFTKPLILSKYVVHEPFLPLWDHPSRLSPG